MSEPVGDTRGQTPADVQRIKPPAPVFAAGDTVPNLSSWVLERNLGGGGFGEVWLARHAFRAEEKPRAVKFCTDPAARHRLVTHEQNVVRRVMKYAGGHPNIVPLLDCNLDGDIPWLMYEFVEGGTLAGLVAEWRELPLPKRLGKAVRVLHALAGALAACHRFDPPLVHRDMKPQNVLMAGPVPRITDFGIGSVVLQPQDGATSAHTAAVARVPTNLQGAGTRLYAPPEQTLGSTPDPRDDVYALGIIAYQLVTADLTTGPGADASLELRDLKIPGEVASLIIRSAALDPNRRPKDATEWETVLAVILQKAQKQPEVPDTSAPGSKPVLLPEPDAKGQQPRFSSQDFDVPKPDPTAVLPRRTGPPPIPQPLPASLPPKPRPVARPVAEPARAKPRKPWAVSFILLGGAVFLVLAFAFAIHLAEHGKRSEPTNPTVKSNDANGSSPVPKPGDPKPGETRDVQITYAVSMKFCWIPAGGCQLGCPKSELDEIKKRSGRETIPDIFNEEIESKRGRFTTNGFWMGKYEVTQAEWFAVMRNTNLPNPSWYRVGGQYADKLGKITDTSQFPVEQVSWNDCQKFLKTVNSSGGIRGVFGKSGEFALPHENAWEYACRGGLGNQQAFHFGTELNGTQANIDGRFPFGTTEKGPFKERTTRVGDYEVKFPHPWGLCDMHGNVEEWCENADDKFSFLRVLRGGSHHSDGQLSRAAHRSTHSPDNDNPNFGLRLVIRLD